MPVCIFLKRVIKSFYWPSLFFPWCLWPCRTVFIPDPFSWLLDKKNLLVTESLSVMPSLRNRFCQIETEAIHLFVIDKRNNWFALCNGSLNFINRTQCFDTTIRKCIVQNENMRSTDMSSFFFVCCYTLLHFLYFLFSFPSLLLFVSLSFCIFFLFSFTFGFVLFLSCFSFKFS